MFGVVEKRDHSSLRTVAAECLIFRVSAAMAIGVHQIIQVQWKKDRISLLAHLLMQTISFLELLLMTWFGTVFFVLVFSPYFLA